MSEETKRGDSYMSLPTEVANEVGYVNEHDYWLSCMPSDHGCSSTDNCVVDDLVVTMEGGQASVDKCGKNENQQEFRKANGTRQQLHVHVPERFMNKPCGSVCKLQCSSKISKEQQVAIHTAFWNLADHGRQRSFIHKNCTRLKPEYGCTKNNGSDCRSSSGYTVVYNLTVDGEDIRVCRLFFMNTLDIGEKFIRNTFKKADEKAGVVHSDRRGLHGKHQIKESLKEGVRSHIESFPKLNLKSKTNKQYLPGSLSVARMHRLYTEEMNSSGSPMVKLATYSKIFKTDFNLAFFTHKKDRCHMCKTYRDASVEKRAEMQVTYDAHLRNDANRCATKPEVEDVQTSKCSHEVTSEVSPVELSCIQFDSDIGLNLCDSSELDNEETLVISDESLAVSKEPLTISQKPLNMSPKPGNCDVAGLQPHEDIRDTKETYTETLDQPKHHHHQHQQSSVKYSCGLTCKHRCTNKISKEQQAVIYTAFWNLKDHSMQRNFIHENCTRIRAECGHAKNTDNTNSNRRGYTVSYNLTVNGEVLEVCKPFFMKTLDIGERFIRNTFKKFDERAGTVRKGKSTNDLPRTKHEIKESLKDRIRNHIKSFPKFASPPQRRSKSNNRQYLSSNLSVAQMYRLYAEEMKSNNLPILTHSMYWKIFKTEFDLAFLAPKKK